MIRPAALVIFCCLFAGCSKQDKQREKPIPQVGYVVAKYEQVSLPLTLSGRTVAFETSEVRPQVSGIVQKRFFKEGALVRAGQTLYQIDPSIYRAAAGEAIANLASARAAQSAATFKADRFVALATDNGVSKLEASDAVSASQQAAALAAQTRARLDTAKINLRFTRVPAPISGRIGRSLGTTGGLVTESQTSPLATIQRLDPIYVDLQQSSADLLRLREGISNENTVIPVYLTLENGKPYNLPGRLQFAEAIVDQSTGTVTLRAQFPNPGGLLLPGMYVRASLAQAAPNSVMLIPQAAVSRTPTGQASVMLVGNGNKALRRLVDASRTFGNKWVVTGGLKVGDRIIVEGLGKIRPGSAIVPVKATRSAAKSASPTTVGS